MMNKARISILVVSVLTILCSCERTKPQEEVKVETPKALKDDKPGIESYGRRSGNDLVDELYAELVDKSSTLKKLEGDLGVFLDKSQDLKESVDEYGRKSTTYYSAANVKISGIADSLLRKEIVEIIAASKNKFATRTSELNELMSVADKNGISISDHHTILKIVLTLPLIENYQSENLPEKSKIKELIREQRTFLERIDSLTLR